MIIMPVITNQIKHRLYSEVLVGEEDECWPWFGSKDTDGYGIVRIEGRLYKTHRLSYYIATGDDPGELKILHDCNNCPCCNPKHLYKGTSLDNARDRDLAGNTVVPYRHTAQHHQRNEEMRTMYATGKYSQRQLAKLFNVTQGYVSMIVNHKKG